MMKQLINMTVGLGILVLAAQQVSAQSPAQAQAPAQSNQNCAPRPLVLDRLARGYGETRQSIGLGAQGAVVEVFASDETGSWTITVTLPNGLTCLVASGQSYETLAEALPPKGNDA